MEVKLLSNYDPNIDFIRLKKSQMSTKSEETEKTLVLKKGSKHEQSEYSPLNLQHSKAASAVVARVNFKNDFGIVLNTGSTKGRSVVCQSKARK